MEFMQNLSWRKKTAYIMMSKLKQTLKETVEPLKRKAQSMKLHTLIQQIVPTRILAGLPSVGFVKIILVNTCDLLTPSKKNQLMRPPSYINSLTKVRNWDVMWCPVLYHVLWLKHRNFCTVRSVIIKHIAIITYGCILEQNTPWVNIC